MLFFDRILFIILFLWQLPQNIVGLSILLTIKKKRILPCKEYCISFLVEHDKPLLSMGSFFFETNEMFKDTTLYTHELFGHARQSKILGPLYLPLIVIPLLAWKYLRDKERYLNYYSFPTEIWANSLAGLDAVCVGGKWKLSYISYIED